MLQHIGSLAAAQQPKKVS